MDNTKLIAQAISWLRADDKFPRVDANDIVQELAVALEAAESELTRRDTVQALHEEGDRIVLSSAIGAVVCNASNHPKPSAVLGRDISPLRAKLVDAVVAAGFTRAAPVSLEAGRTNPIVATWWSESLPNDGTFEYTSGGDCHGGNVYYQRRTPELRQQVGGWEFISREVYEASKKNWPSEWLDVETEGDNRV